MARKANATGRPRNISTVEPPSISHAAACQDIRRAVDRIVARSALGMQQAVHAEQDLDRRAA